LFGDLIYDEDNRTALVVAGPDPIEIEAESLLVRV